MQIFGIVCVIIGILVFEIAFCLLKNAKVMYKDFSVREDSDSINLFQKK